MLDVAKKMGYMRVKAYMLNKTNVVLFYFIFQGNKSSIRQSSSNVLFYFIFQGDYSKVV